MLVYSPGKNDHSMAESVLWWQVTHTYSTAALRSDYSLLHYGFVLDSEQPLLAGNDHIAGFEYDDDLLYCEYSLPLANPYLHPYQNNRCCKIHIYWQWLRRYPRICPLHCHGKSAQRLC